MGLLTPLALALLVLVPVPLLLARLRPPVRRIAVAGLHLWREAVPSSQARFSLRRFAPRWLVAVQMAFIAVVVLALARPTVTSTGAPVAVVVDVSGSMGARDGAATRLDSARAAIDATVAGLAGHPRVQLIAAASRPRLVGVFAAGSAELRDALARLVVVPGRADLDGAVQLARGAGASTTYVFTDQGAPEAAPIPAGGISWHAVGVPAENVAIAQLLIHRGAAPSAPVRAFVEVVRFGASAAAVTLEVVADGRAVARRAVTLAPGGHQTLAVDLPLSARIVRARVVEPDALVTDNERWAVVPDSRPLRLARAGPASRFLDGALAVLPDVSRVAADDGTLDVAVCVACGPAVAAAPGVLRLSPGTADGAAGTLEVTAPDHPLASGLDLAGLSALPLADAPVPDAGVVVVRAAGRPAVVAWEQDGRRVVEIRLDLERSALALSPAFPVLVSNVVDWLSGRREQPLDVVAGEPLTWVLPGGEPVSVTRPDGRASDARVSGARVTVSDTDRPGAYIVRTARAGGAFVVNPAVGTESDLQARSASLPLMRADAESTSGGRASVNTSVAWILWIVAALLIGLEWRMRPARPLWRGLVAVCLVLAAVGVRLPLGRAALTVMAALDRSASLTPSEQQEGLDRVAGMVPSMRSGDRLGAVVFGAGAAVAVPASERTTLAALTTTIGETRSDIGAAIRLARAGLPRDGSGRVLLVSDGRDTEGDGEAEATRAAADGVPIDVVVPQGASGRIPVVARLFAPQQVRVDEPFPVSIEIGGAPGMRGRVVVFRDDVQLLETQTRLGPDGTGRVAVTDRRTEPGVHVYRTTVVNEDDPLGDLVPPESSGAVVSVAGVPALLYVSERDALLAPLFRAAGFQVATVRPGGLPTASAALAPYDAVVLDDVPAARIGTAQLSALAEAVERRGEGLLLLGSAGSLSLDGYPTGPLGPLLPIDLRPRVGSRTPDLGLVVVFDKSGSMADLAGGVPKIEIARQSVLRVIDVLPPGDALGVIGFDAAPVPVLPLAAAPDGAALHARLRDVTPGGTTLIAPAVELAVSWLRERAPSATHRQILLLSDGRSSPADAARLQQAVAGAGIEVSVVAIGGNADRPLLEALARQTGGRAYFPETVSDLPLVVAREAARAAGGRIVEERFVPRADGHPLLAGLDLTAVPALGGYVVSAARPAATAVLRSHLDDPVLAVWQAGLGRVGVFTAGAGSAWSGGWRGWPEAPRLWTQTVRWLGRRGDDRALQLSVVDRGAEIELLLDAVGTDGAMLPLTGVAATVRMPDGTAATAPLVATADGRYGARVSSRGDGPYVVSVGGLNPTDGTEHRTVGGAYLSANRERPGAGPDIATLERLAALTGGRRLTVGGTVFDVPRPFAWRDASGWCGLAGLVLFLGDLVRPFRDVLRRRTLQPRAA